MSRGRSIMADIFGVFNTNMAVLIIGFVIGIILPNELGPEATGLYYAILVIPQLTHSLIDLGTRPAIVMLSGRKKVPDEELLSALVFVFAVSTLACVVIYGGIFWWINNPDYSSMFIAIILLNTPLRLVTAYGAAFMLAKEKIRKYNRINWLFPLVNLLGILLFVSLLDLGVLGALLAVISASFVVAVYALTLIFRKIRLKLRMNAGIIGDIYKYGLIYALSFLVIRFNYRVDIFLLERLSTYSETGYYSLGVNIAELIFQIPFALWIVVVSRSARAEDQTAMARTVLKLLRVAFLTAMVASAALYFLSPWAITLVYGTKFIPSIPVVQQILPGILFVVIFKVLNGHLAGMGKPWVPALAFLPSVLLNIGLNLWWIPLYGAQGAVMATNISYTLGAFILLIVYRKMMKVSWADVFVIRRSDFSFIAQLRDFLRRKKGREGRHED